MTNHLTAIIKCLGTSLLMLFLSGSRSSVAQPSTSAGGPSGAIVVIVPGLDHTALSLMGARDDQRPFLLYERKLRHIHYRPLYDGGWTPMLAGNLSAIATGRLSGEATLGLNENRQPTPNIVEQAEEEGVHVALITLDNVVAPSLAAFYSHQANQKRYKAIGEELLGISPEVVIGSAGASGNKAIARFREQGYQVETKARKADNLRPNQGPQALLMDARQIQKAQDQDDFFADALQGALNVTASGRGPGLIIMSMGGLKAATRMKSPEAYQGQIEVLEESLPAIVAQARSRNMLLMIVGASGAHIRIRDIPREGPFKLNRIDSAPLQLLPCWLEGPGSNKLPNVVDNHKLYLLLTNAIRGGS